MTNNKCEIGIKCGGSCISARKKCRVDNLKGKKLASAMSDKIKAVSLDFSEVLAEGAYGTVSIDRKNNVVKKTLKAREDGANAFGPHEVELGIKMGEAGYSPKVYKDLTNSSQIVMDVVPGTTLWKSFRQEPDLEPTSMTPEQGAKALDSILYMHKELGYSHNDAHVLQFLINNNDVKLIDFGLSKPISEDPKAALTDLSKMWKFAGLDNIKDNPEYSEPLAITEKYRAIKGSSKAAKAAKLEVVNEYQEYLNK